MSFNLSVVCFTCLVYLTIYIGSAPATPYLREKRQSGPWNEIVDECKINETIEITCQRCAKETKSNIVYPMCCEGREAARDWCERYISYGLKNEEE